MLCWTLQLPELSQLPTPTSLWFALGPASWTPRCLMLKTSFGLEVCDEQHHRGPNWFCVSEVAKLSAFIFCRSTWVAKLRDKPGLDWSTCPFSPPPLEPSVCVTVAIFFDRIVSLFFWFRCETLTPRVDVCRMSAFVFGPRFWAFCDWVTAATPVASAFWASDWFTLDELSPVS